MAWADSRAFDAFFDSNLDNSTDIDLDGDTHKAALFDNTITPDRTVAAASTAYNAGVWLTSAEVDDTTEWDAGGEPLTSVTSSAAAGVYTFTAADTPSGGSSATLANVYGCLVYSDTSTTAVANHGICFNYFGGANSVTNGTFTIVWSGTGIMTVTT